MPEQKGPGRPAKSTKPDNSPEAVKEAQENHPTMKWFDRFEIMAKVEGFVDTRTNETKTVIRSYQLTKKLTPVFIEPELCMGINSEPGFNHHAIWSSRGPDDVRQVLYLPKGEYEVGKEITWPEMSKLLNLPNNHPNTIAWMTEKNNNQPVNF